MQNADEAVGFYERFDFLQDEGPLELVVRLIGTRIVGYLLVQFHDEVAHQLHFLEQQADHDESGVVAKFLYHQVRSAGRKKEGSLILACAPDVSELSPECL